MKGLETGKEKIQKICDVLRKETLEPAKQEAAEIIENSKLQAHSIIENAKKKAAEIIKEAEDQCVEKKKTLDSSLHFASKQVLEQLKQTIEEHLFSHVLTKSVEQDTKQPQVIAEIIQSFLQMIENKGIQEEWVITIPKNVTPRAITSLIAQKFMHKLQEKDLVVGDFEGGARICFKKQHITVDLSNLAIQELIAGYIRRDLRDFMFGI